MPADSFDEFRRLVLSDPGLQQHLIRCADQKSLFERVLKIGTERGYAFSEQDLENAARTNRRGWLERWLYQ